MFLPDACKFAQDENHARNQSGMPVEKIVDVGGGVVWFEFAGIEEADEGLNDDLRSLVLDRKR